MPASRRMRWGGIDVSSDHLGQSETSEIERLRKIQRAAAILRARLGSGAPVREVLSEGAYRAYCWLCEALDEAEDA